MDPLRVLITNTTLASRTGTETYVRDLALGLLRRGHWPVVYSPRPGSIAEELRLATVPVTDDLETVSTTPDIIHGHHHVETLTALLRFPAVPAIFVCHDRTSWMDAPPRFSRIGRYVAVDENCRERLVCECGIPPERVTVHCNSVDLQRFASRGPLPGRPERALLYVSYRPAKGVVEILRAECALAGATLDIVGGETECARPEELLRDYDLVFAKARCAIEAMAVGAAVVLWENGVAGPMVTRENFDRLRRLNFGRRAIHANTRPDALRTEIARYDAEGAAAVSARARAVAGLDDAIDSMIGIYRKVLRDCPAQEDAPADLRAASVDLRSFTGTLEHYRRADRWSRQMEEELRAARMFYVMPAVPEENVEKITVSVLDVPRQVVAGRTFGVKVWLSNASGLMLNSFEPHAVQLGCRWDGVEGARTPLLPPLPPGGKHCYTAVVKAPDEPGEHQLFVALVQEGVRWFPVERGEWQVEVLQAGN